MILSLKNLPNYLSILHLFKHNERICLKICEMLAYLSPCCQVGKLIRNRQQKHSSIHSLHFTSSIQSADYHQQWSAFFLCSSLLWPSSFWPCSPRWCHNRQWSNAVQQHARFAIRRSAISTGHASGVAGHAISTAIHVWKILSSNFCQNLDRLIKYVFLSRKF